MKIGFLTACLDNLKLEQIVSWAATEGFKMLEIACWPDEPVGKGFGEYHQEFGGPHHINVEKLDNAKAVQIKKLLEDNNIGISALAYYPNNLEPNIEMREKNHNHLKKVIDAASILGVEYVGTFIGGDKYKSIEENLEEFSKVFPAIVGYAEEKNVKIIIENCPMHDFWKTGYNLAFSPIIWEKMFKIIPSKYFGINYDPSHLIFEMIDYLEPIKEFAERIFHIHAKDVEVYEDILKKHGIFGEYGVTGCWWRYRMPGLGEIKWRKFIDLLYEIKFDGTISIEHGDPLWWGNDEKIKEGLIIGKKFLEDELSFFKWI